MYDESANVKTRFRTIRPAIWPPVAMLPRRSRMKSAPRIPKIAPDAPTVGTYRAPEERACRAGHAGAEVQEQELPAADLDLEDRADVVERVHVQREVEVAAVQEHRRDHPPPLVVRDADGMAVDTAAVPDQEAVIEDPVPRERAVDRELGDGDRDVDRDQHDGHHVHVRSRSRCCATGRPCHLADPLRLPRVIRAAQPDRRGGHALVTDRAPALGARETGFAVRVAVARTGRVHAASVSACA